MSASKIMARITTTTQKKNTTMPGTEYPATVLALATSASYPPLRDLLGAETKNVRSCQPRPFTGADSRAVKPGGASGMARRFVG
jgi:hypothetical protein